MSVKLAEFFKRSEIYDCDTYTADYTNQTNGEKKVVISTEPFPDIPYFHLKKANSNNIPYLGINFESYKAFITGIENCECAFSSMTERRKGWLMFLETKYCTSDNIEGYAFKVNSQMHDTLNKLISLDLVKLEERNVYFVYSSPGNDSEIPFGSFTFSQNDTLKQWESTGIHILGNNSMLIATPYHLFEPKIEI